MEERREIIMDMKRILQAVDGVASKPVEGAGDMSKFLSVVDEAAMYGAATTPPPSASPSGLTPAQQQALAPYLVKDPDGSQYYDYPTTDTKEKGAIMGTTIKAPGYLAQIKSPQGQAEVIKHLLATTDPKNAVKPASVTNTSVDDKNLFPDGLEENTLSKFLSIVKENDVKIISEGKGSSNRLTTAESMVIEQPAITPRKEVTSPVLNIDKDATPSMIGKYFKSVEQEIKEAEERTRDRTKQLAERVANKINNQRIAELSNDTLASYKKKAGADASAADKAGDFEKGNKRFKGITKATIKQFDNDLKKHKDPVKEAEGTPSGVAHLTRELLTHIVQQSGKEGAHAVVKSLTWGDGAAKELLHLIIDDLKDDIKGMDESNLSEIAKGQKDSNGFTKCWPGKHAEGTKKGKNGGQVRNCVPNEAVNSAQQAAIAIAKKAGKK